MDGRDYFTISQASQFSGFHPQTIRKYVDNNQIKSFKTPSGQRRIHRIGLEEFINLRSSPISYQKPSFTISNSSNSSNSSNPSSQITNRTNFLYARVSSKKQLDDLDKQIKFLQTYRSEYVQYTLISDISSGINFKRKGLQTLLDSCIQGTIGEVVVAHKDRLCRFGFELLQLFITKSGGIVTVIDCQTNKSSEQELAEDLLSIVHIYSCKQMGKRSYQAKQGIKNVESETETISSAEENI
jgi:predicted site-specific integrase-resolvase